MFFYTLLLVSCAPFAVLAGSPGPLKSLSGRDYSHHLKRTDEPFPIRLTVAKRGAAAVPRTLQVPDVPVARRSSPAGVLVAARQVSCDYGYSLCADGVGCCPTGAQCCTEEVLCCSGGACCGGSCCENNGVCW
ncbi:hypothetical protein CPB86DRAFT_778438 [Serendipita vermifera]|nr:hypothetical protein CPB86DRAFT_778438 [Serendipita vermifera]